MLKIDNYELILPNNFSVTWICDDPLAVAYKFYTGSHPEDLSLISTTTDLFYSDIAISRLRGTQDIIVKVEALNATQEVIDEVIQVITSNNLKNYLKFRKWFENNYYKSLNAAGHKVVILKRKISGTRCTEPGCVHSSTGESTNPRCLVCYGTGFVGGYYTPISCKGLFGPFQVYASDRGGEIPFEIENTTVIIPPYPSLHRSDIIVDMDSLNRYQVLGESVKFFRYNSTKLGSIYYEVRKLSQSDPAYLIDFTEQVTSVSSVTYNSTSGLLTVEGTKLRPRYGSTYIVVWHTDLDGNIQETVYNYENIKNLKDSKITFNIGTEYTDEFVYTYRFVSNNEYFDGEIDYE